MVWYRLCTVQQQAAVCLARRLYMAGLLVLVRSNGRHAG